MLNTAKPFIEIRVLSIGLSLFLNENFSLRWTFCDIIPNFKHVLITLVQFYSLESVGLKVS